MVSQKPRSKKVSVTASQAFATLLREAGVEFDAETWNNSLEGDATNFTNYWRQIFGMESNAARLLNAIPELVEQYPVPGEGKDVPRPDVVYIEDLKAFKAGLARSNDSGPMVQWGDLPMSRC